VRLTNGPTEHGDPSQDVATAAVLFLVDAKLVLLQPSANEYGELKYDMRVIAHDVEYYTLTREQPFPASVIPTGDVQTISSSAVLEEGPGQGLHDSLWYFNGSAMHVWPEIIDVLSSAPSELERDLPKSVEIQTDFYPLSTMVDKGMITGIEPDLVQRRDVDFSFFRHSPRTHLFIPALLRHHLAQYDSSAALHLSHYYGSLSYFPHSLEILLHDVLDEEVDASPQSTESTLLPTVLSFLSSFPTYLDIVAGCTRKTELRSWRTLFSCLPPVQSLFEESLTRGLLKTAGSYLLIIHAFDEGSLNTDQIASLLQRAKEAGDWDLCRELARFLVGIDDTGALLDTVIAAAGLRPSPRTNGHHHHHLPSPDAGADGDAYKPHPNGVNGNGDGNGGGGGGGGGGGYFDSLSSSYT